MVADVTVDVPTFLGWIIVKQLERVLLLMSPKLV